MIQKIAFTAKILICTLAGFFVLMSIDAFLIDVTIWERIGRFFISILPGLMMIVLY